MINFYEGSAGGERGMFAYPVSDTINAVVLAANTAVLAAIPTGANIVVFSGNHDFYAAYGNSSVAATIPAATISNGTANELNPSIRYTANNTHISLIAPAATVVTLAFYEV